MPNWVKNIVSFEGDSKEIESLFELVKSTDKDGEINLFDFDKIIEMPKSLNITSGGLIDSGIEIIKYKESGDKSMLDYSKKHFLELNTWDADLVIEHLSSRVDWNEVKTAISNLENYGHKDWYTWRVSNWGTKWNTSEPTIEDNIVSFETAWSTPYEIFEELSLKFPNLKIKVKYADEDIGSNCGQIELQNGQVLNDIEYDGIKACEVWGYDPADYFPEVYRDRRIDDLLD
jgi:hypothetical protein